MRKGTWDLDNKDALGDPQYHNIRTMQLVGLK
jgi:hypothetical protein